MSAKVTNKLPDSAFAIVLRECRKYLPSLIACVVLLTLGEFLSNGFLSMNNISSILMTTSLLAIASIGQAFVIISGEDGIDMSLGAVMSMTALLGPMIHFGGAFNMPLAICVVVVAGGLVGLANGIGSQVIKVPPLVMTLVAATVVNGLALFITRGQPATRVTPELLAISNTLAGPIRILALIGIVLVVVMEIFLRRSRFGKTLFLVGNNRQASYLCGLPVRTVAIMAYVLGGAFGGLAGYLLVGYAGAAQMQRAANYPHLSVASVVIGGTKLTGGSGGFIGGALGALVLILLTSILQALNMPPGVRSLVQGVILLAILMSNSRSPNLRA